MGVSYPARLEYTAFDAHGEDLSFPELGLAREQAETPTRDDLASQLLAMVREITGLPDLELDDDGDIGVRFGDLSVFLRLVGNPTYLRLFSAVVEEVPGSPAVFSTLNARHMALGPLRFVWREGTVFALADVPAWPLSRTTLAQTLALFYEATDGLTAELHAALDPKGGKAQRPHPTVH